MTIVSKSDRKFRLAACAMVRRLPDADRGTSGQAIALAERFADGKATVHELAAARFGGRYLPGHAAWAVCWAPDQDPRAMLKRAMAWVRSQIQTTGTAADVKREQSIQNDLLREVTGNPLEPVPIDPGWLAWNDGTVRKMAQAIYEEKAFEQMPVLGDALEEAGCTEPRLLDHCRSGGVHVRGCWLLDLVRGLA